MSNFFRVMANVGKPVKVHSEQDGGLLDYRDGWLTDGKVYTTEGKLIGESLDYHGDDYGILMDDTYDNVWSISDSAALRSQGKEYIGVRTSPEHLRCQQRYSTLRWFCCGVQVGSVWLDVWTRVLFPCKRHLPLGIRLLVRWHLCIGKALTKIRYHTMDWYEKSLLSCALPIVCKFCILYLWYL